MNAQNEILRHDLRTQEYFNIKLSESNQLKDCLTNIKTLRSQVTQTDQVDMVSKKCQTTGGIRSKSKLRHDRIDSVSPISYAGRSASTLSSSAAVRNQLNNT